MQINCRVSSLAKFKTKYLTNYDFINWRILALFFPILQLFTNNFHHFFYQFYSRKLSQWQGTRVGFNRESRKILKFGILNPKNPNPLKGPHNKKHLTESRFIYKMVCSLVSNQFCLTNLSLRAKSNKTDASIAH